MKRLALFTVLALCIPTAAFAWPHWRIADNAQRASDRDRDHERDRDAARHASTGDAGWSRERYARYDRSHWAKDYRGRWVSLAQGVNSQGSRQFITVGANARFRKLRVEGVRGEPVLLKIVVEFADTTGQSVDYREVLPRGEGEVIDLNGGDRRINRIIVYTDPHSRGTYSVYGG